MLLHGGGLKWEQGAEPPHFNHCYWGQSDYWNFWLSLPPSTELIFFLCLLTRIILLFNGFWFLKKNFSVGFWARILQRISIIVKLGMKHKTLQWRDDKEKGRQNKISGQHKKMSLIELLKYTQDRALCVFMVVDRDVTRMTRHKDEELHTNIKSLLCLVLLFATLR